MLDSAEKLQHFSRVVLSQAKKECDAILEQARVELKEKIEVYENVCLEEAYSNIQKQVVEIQNKANKTVSKLQHETRTELLKKREDMVGEVFDMVLAKILSFKATEEYKAFLISNIKDTLNLVGTGDKVLYLDKSDEKYAEDIKAEFGDVMVEILSEEEIIGGCRVLNKSISQIADGTISLSINIQKQNFLKMSGLIL